MEQGRAIWITGLAGAGKSTVAGLLAERLRRSGQTPILLDGDALREVFGRTTQFEKEDRRALAGQYGRLCRELAGQGFPVICATISMFDDVRAWNRENIPGYFEVYLRVPADELGRRDQKGLYSGRAGGAEGTVVGVAQDFEAPKAPDLVIDHFGRVSPASAVERIWAMLHPNASSTGA